MADPVAGTTHHIVLNDGTTRLGLISADEMRSFTRIPVNRTSLKTAQGDTLYSDLEPPYNTKMQDKFNGGRAQKNLRDDPAKFYDSWNIDTRIGGQCILGPLVHTPEVNPGTPEYNPGTVSGRAISYGKIQQTSGTSGVSLIFSAARAAQSFTIPSGFLGQLTSIEVNVKPPVENSTTITCRLHDDNGGEPGTQLASKTAVVSAEGWVTFTFSSPVSVTVGTTYWLSLAADKFPTSFYISWSDVYSGGYMSLSSNGGSSWNDQPERDMQFKVHFSQVKRAMSFNYSGAGSYSVAYVRLYMKAGGTVTPTVRIETDDGGKPSGTLAHANATKTLDGNDVETSFKWVRVDFTDFSLTKGTTYWIVVYDDTERAQNNMLYWGSDNSASYSGGSAALKIGSGAWAADDTVDFYFRINDGAGLVNPAFKFFVYKGQLYVVDAPTEGSDISHLWMNGDRGAADDNSGDKTKLNDATKSWTADEWIGCVVKITGGPGEGEWRTITDNDGTSLTVDDEWTTTHTTDTEYVILGSDKWTDVSPGGADQIDTAITDVCVANGIVYFACGDDQNILRYREYNNSGTWTKESADDGTNKAVLLMEHKQKIFRAASDNQVSYSDVKAWGTNLSFGTAIKVGTTDYPITALLVYDSDVWVGKEDSLWSIKADVPEEIPVDFSSLAGADNCRRMVKWNVYLFFPLGYGLERLYGLQVDDMGPNRDEGLPDGRQGPIADLLATPGILYAAIDAGDENTSSILAYNELGWHEFIRATSGDARIRALFQQVVPGGPNRLWFSMGTDIAYVKMPSKGVNPLNDTAVEYASSGELRTSWVDLHLADIEKLFKDLKLVSENLTTGITIEAFYQLDDAGDADAWTQINEYDTSPIEEAAIGAAVTGRRIRFKLAFVTNDSSITPNLIAWTLDSLARVVPKSRFEPLIRLEDDQELLNGDLDTNGRADIIGQLDTWAGSATPLTMTSCDPAYTYLTVLIEPLVETAKRYEVEADGGGGRWIGGEGRLVILEA